MQKHDHAFLRNSSITPNLIIFFHEGPTLALIILFISSSKVCWLTENSISLNCSNSILEGKDLCDSNMCSQDNRRTFYLLK